MHCGFAHLVACARAVVKELLSYAPVTSLQLDQMASWVKECTAHKCVLIAGAHLLLHKVVRGDADKMEKKQRKAVAAVVLLDVEKHKNTKRKQ